MHTTVPQKMFKSISVFQKKVKEVEKDLVQQLLVEQLNPDSMFHLDTCIRYMKIDLDDKTDVLTYHKKLLATAKKEKEELKTKLESFETSSKSLNTLLNCQLSANDKTGFGHDGAKESKVTNVYGSGVRDMEAAGEDLCFPKERADLKINLDDKTDVLTYHKKLLAEAVKEKEELKTKLESFETSSKSLNTLLNSQLSANDKAGFGYNGGKEYKVSETVTSVSKVETSNSETSNDKVEMPKSKTFRMSEPIIEEWESDSEDDEIVVKPKEVTKTVKPSFEKIESVNARNETVRQAKNPRKNNKSPRGNKRNWNGKMTQKLEFKNHSSDNEESLGEDASKQGRIDDADAKVTFIDETSNDARNKNKKISNIKRWKMTKKQL
ncbi:hypothetical protein Tco_0184292 [Tanacetum coccineum]